MNFNLGKNKNKHTGLPISSVMFAFILLAAMAAVGLTEVQRGLFAPQVASAAVSGSGIILAPAPAYSYQVPRPTLINFSQIILNLFVGRNSSVKIYGNAPFYISGNTNPAAVSVSISGSSLNVHANSKGFATIIVCQNYSAYNVGKCGNVFVNVWPAVIGGGGGGGGGGYGYSTASPNQ